MGKTDFKQLKKFTEQLNKLGAEKISQFAESTTKNLASRLLRKVKSRTPVKSSDLRDKWTISNVTRTKNGCTIDIINPMEYTAYVEYGHRTPNHQGWVDGRFMLTISEQELKADAPRIIEQRLAKFLGGVVK